MDLFELLKKFKTIEPDPDYTAKSRRILLAAPRGESRAPVGLVMRLIETAGSLVLAGILIFAVVGGFSGASKYFSPVSFSGIDPVALHAEADAIDMQINLSEMSYSEAAAQSGGSTAPMATIHPVSTANALPVAIATTTPSSTPVAVSLATTTASSSLSINEALQKLEQ